MRKTTYNGYRKSQWDRIEKVRRQAFNPGTQFTHKPWVPDPNLALRKQVEEQLDRRRP